MDSSSLRQEWQYLNRCYIAQIQGIDETKGSCRVVVLDGLDSERGELEIPLGGFGIQNFKSSWMRYMPQINELVYVAFGPQNQARILGYATFPGGYEKIAGFTRTAPTQFPTADFIRLRQGEWDMRSSGGAYIHGNRDGMLLLSTSPSVRLRLDKPNDEARAEAGLWITGGNGNFSRIGDVKRRLPVAFRESDLSSLEPTARKEWWLHLENPSLTGVEPSVILYDEQVGAVRDAVGAPYLSDLLPGTPLRYRKKIWSIGSTSAFATSVFSEEVDALGNHKVDYGIETTNVEVNGGPATSLNVSMLSMNVETTTSASVSALTTAKVEGIVSAQLISNVLAQVNAAVVQLGGPSALSNPAVHGTVLFTILQTMIAALLVLAATMTGLEGAITPKGIAWAAVTAALTPLQVLLAIPPAPGNPASLLSAKVFME